jgi:hypothetical protein
MKISARVENSEVQHHVLLTTNENSHRSLMEHTDTAAEIQNTLRRGISVILNNIEIIKS